MANIGNYQISDTGNELAAMGHGNTLNQIVDLYGVYNRAARRIMQDVDLQETRIVANFGKVYNGVYDYALFTDMKGNSLADFYPQANRTNLDDYGQLYNKDFDLQKNYSLKPMFTMKYTGAERTIRLNAANLVAGTQVNAADLINDNGTWVNGSSASAPTNNALFYTSGVAGSVQTNLAVSGSAGYLENSTMTAVNLTDNFNNNADQFFWVYLPTAANFTSIDFRLGSSSSKYYHLDGITTDFMGNAFVDGWNLIKSPFTSMVAVSTPNIAAINYSRITFNYNGVAMNQILINQVYSRIGTLFYIEYYSKYLFRDNSTNVFKEKVTADTDIVNLDTDGYNLFLFASGAEATQQMQGLDAAFFDAGNFEQRYTDALATYKNKYKGEKTKPHSYYYNQPRAGYRRYMSSSWGLPPA